MRCPVSAMVMPPYSAALIPKMIEPSICETARSGLMTVPASTTTHASSTAIFPPGLRPTDTTIAMYESYPRRPQQLQPHVARITPRAWANSSMKELTENAWKML
jgi:hypothetical protein